MSTPERQPLLNRAQKLALGGAAATFLAAGVGLDRLGIAIVNKNRSAARAEAAADLPRTVLQSLIASAQRGGSLAANHQSIVLGSFSSEASTSTIPVDFRVGTTEYGAYWSESAPNLRQVTAELAADTAYILEYSQPVDPKGQIPDTDPAHINSQGQIVLNQGKTSVPIGDVLVNGVV